MIIIIVFHVKNGYQYDQFFPIGVIDAEGYKPICLLYKQYAEKVRKERIISYCAKNWFSFHSETR